MADEPKPKVSAPFEAQYHAGRLQAFVIDQLLRGMHTANVVKVLAVHPGTGRVGTVDVQPLLQDRTTRDVVIDQAPIYQLPYFRLQGGISAVWLDPVVGDLGLIVCAERDITNVIATREQGAAPSDRAYSEADGLYLGGFLNNDPTQYVKFNPAGGIEIVSTGNLSITAPGDALIHVGGDLAIQVDGNLTVTATATTWNGPVTFNNPITTPNATIAGRVFTAHTHPTGGPNTGTPNP